MRKKVPPKNKAQEPKAQAKAQAPKGRNISAQGNALGNAFREDQSPEGAAQKPFVCDSSSFRPLSSFLREPLRNGHSATASSDPNGIRTLTLTAVTVGDFSERNTKITSADAHRVKDLWLEPGDILIQRSNAPELVGTSRLYRGDRNYAIFPDLMIRVRLNDEADPRFIELVLQSEPLRQYFKGRAKGMSGSMPKIDQETISEAPIPHFHIDDQRRIVAEIEKQFTRLEAGVAALRRVQANLKRYRAAVLKAACEGRLVPTEAELARAEGRPFESGKQLLARILTERRQNWQGRGSFVEPRASDACSLPELPIGWCWARVEQLSNVVRGASPRPAGDPRYFGGNVPWITVGPLTADNSPYLKEVSASLNELGREHSRYIEAHTLLLTNSGATLGVPKITLIGGCINDGVAALLDVSYPLKLYLLYFLRTQTEGLRGVNQGAAQPNLNTTIIKDINVPLPPLAEQTRIVAEVERRLSVVEELEAVVTTNLQRATRLRQSILQKAFTGEL